MEILFLTRDLPYPPTDGWKIRVFSLIRQLSRRHRISLVSFMRTTERPDGVQGLEPYCERIQVVPRVHRYSPWKLLLGLVGPKALPIVAYQDRRMREAISSVTRDRKFDVVQAESLHVAQYALELSTPAVLDLHNIESMLMKRSADAQKEPLKRGYMGLTARKLAAYERAVCGRFAYCLTCSEEDRRVLVSDTNVERVAVVPNGVDLESYVPEVPNVSNVPNISRGGLPHPMNRLVFVGRMDYRPNVDGAQWFSREVFPLIRKRIPGAFFQIVGGPVAKTVQRLEAPDRIAVTGFVKDVRPYLREATVVVVPLRAGGGTRLKILEALAMGKAVVSTSVGAEGIAALPDRELLIGDDAQAFASHVVSVLEDPNLRGSLGRAGRKLTEEKYGWDAIARDLERVYQECVDGEQRTEKGSLIERVAEARV